MCELLLQCRNLALQALVHRLGVHRYICLLLSFRRRVIRVRAIDLSLRLRLRLRGRSGSIPRHRHIGSCIRWRRWCRARWRGLRGACGWHRRFVARGHGRASASAAHCCHRLIQFSVRVRVRVSCARARAVTSESVTVSTATAGESAVGGVSGRDAAAEKAG